MTIVQTREKHLRDLERLWNDGEVMRWVGFPGGLGISSAGVVDWFDRITADPRSHHFVVLDETGRFCGEAFYRVDQPPVTAGLDIKLLPEARGRGLATQAVTLVVNLVFSSEPGVEAVWTEPSAENLAAQRLYRRCGFAPASRPPHLRPADSYWERRRKSPRQ